MDALFKGLENPREEVDRVELLEDSPVLIKEGLERLELLEDSPGPIEGKAGLLSDCWNPPRKKCIYVNKHIGRDI